MKHLYGGAHSDDKANRLASYLSAFSTALKEKGFGLIYVDAFAGTGQRNTMLSDLPLFGVAAEEMVSKGSARLAIEADPPIHTIVLIENDAKKLAALQILREEYPDRKIVLVPGDANQAVRRLCRGVQWRRPVEHLRGFRGVIFLDPYGMEVDWETVEEIGETRALDCFYLFPLSGLYRQAANEAIDISRDKRERLNRVLGTEEWFDRWYGHPRGAADLFDAPIDAVRTADVEAIESYVRERLQSVFRGVVLPPSRLHYANGAPMASLFFGVSNPSPAAVSVASSIASHILKAPILRRPSNHGARNGNVAE